MVWTLAFICKQFRLDKLSDKMPAVRFIISLKDDFKDMYLSAGVLYIITLSISGDRLKFFPFSIYGFDTRYFSGVKLYVISPD